LRLHIVAVGRIAARDPERALIDDYAGRLDRTGRSLGLGPLSEAQIEDRRGGGMAAEAALIARAVPPGARVMALDERGRMLTSPELAALLARWRDGGAQDAAFLIGGADGLDPGLCEGADAVLSLGPMVWPHRLVRVMLAEQLYRAVTILAGLPYHRR
jgi:23S rRNA (pseudouridine1915-N3)-methyltransferase